MAASQEKRRLLLSMSCAGKPASQCSPGGVEGTFAADDALPKALHDALATGFATLASGPKDWHPGSNEQVLDLVHPSLFCYEWGVMMICA